MTRDGMTRTMWIDGRDGMNVGDVGFLVRVTNAVRGTERYELRSRPPHTDQTHRPLPRGWCGSWNGVSTEGLGVWRVTRFARNGRVEIAEIVDRDELATFLSEYGYPDLLDHCLPPTAAA
jgi:hypothetical protein